MKNYIFNYTEQNPLIVNNYPYGFKLRTDIKYWIESTPKKGDRFCSQTLNPKNGHWNAAKKSTYSLIGIMFTDEKNHVKWEGVSQYDSRQTIQQFITEIGGSDKLNPVQLTIYNEMIGIREVKTDEFTGEIKNDFKVQWEKNYSKTQTVSVRITFDRPDGITPKEIFKAMKTINQEKLMDCLNGYETVNFGHAEGFVRICVRGGIQLTTVHKDSYLEYLATDDNIMSEEV